MKRSRILPKRLPQPQPIDPAEREYMRKLLLYSTAYRKLVNQELNKILDKLKETAAKETPDSIAAQSRSDSAYTTMYANWKKATLLGLPAISKSEMRRVRLMQASVHMDSNIEKDIAKMFETVQKALMKLFPDKTVRKWAEQMASHVNQVSRKNTARVGEAVDLDVEPLLKDGKLNPYFQNVVDENIGLIRSISTERLPQFKNFLVNAITNDSHNTDFWPHIKKYVDKNTMSVEAHARLIARDQVSKLNGKLNQYRQQQIGGVRYVWRTSKDERVRKDHKILDGKTFKWTNPPVVDKRTGRRGHPGYDFQCRCTAEMVLEDVID